MARTHPLATLTALLFLVATTRAATVTKCGCGLEYDCNQLDSWNAASDKSTVLSCDQCAATDNIGDGEKSACLTFEFDDSTASEFSVEFDYFDLLTSSDVSNGNCYSSAAATNCPVWEEEQKGWAELTKNLAGAASKVAGMAVGVLVAIILVPILLVALIVGLSVWCCCMKNRPSTVIVQGGEAGAHQQPTNGKY